MRVCTRPRNCVGAREREKGAHTSNGVFFSSFLSLASKKTTTSRENKSASKKKMETRTEHADFVASSSEWWCKRVIKEIVGDVDVHARLVGWVGYTNVVKISARQELGPRWAAHGRVNEPAAVTHTRP
jgi:hypothetical protein